jgi:formate/nitrite transporter FocA (FNT family)
VSDENRADGTIAESTDHAASGAPDAGWAIGDRFSSEEILQRVLATAEEEVSTGTRELLFSGLAAGFAIVLTFVGHAAVSAYFPESTLLGSLLYPIGFVYIILGRYQLYTENTLPPVALVLARIERFYRIILGLAILVGIAALGIGAATQNGVFFFVGVGWFVGRSAVVYVADRRERR